MEHTFTLWQDGIEVASVTSTNVEQAIREIEHYAMVYSQDSPVEIRVKLPANHFPNDV